MRTRFAALGVGLVVGLVPALSACGLGGDETKGDGTSSSGATASSGPASPTGPTGSATPSASASPVTTMSWEELFAERSPAVVRVATSTCDSSGSVGSGFALDERTVVTAAHVVANARTISLQTPGGQTIAAWPVAVVPEHDTAVLRIEEDLNLDTFPALASSTPARGSELAVIGYPLGDLQVSIVNGIVSRLPAPVDYAEQHVERAFTTNASTNAGNSGGPVFAHSGEVIGLVSGGREWTDDDRPVEGINYMIPVDDIASVVDEAASRKTSVARPCGESDTDDDALRAEGPALVVDFTSDVARYVGQLLYTHGLAINIGAYEAAFSLFTQSAQRNLGGLGKWTTGVQDSRWTEVRVEKATLSAAGDLATANVLLTTTQPDGKGSMSCSTWRLEYEVVMASEMLINKARTTGPKTAC